VVTSSAALGFLVSPVAEPGDAELVAGHLRGERAAFEQLVRKYQAPLQRLARRLTGDGDEAADVVQRAFLRAFRHLHELRDGGAFRGWLYRITVTQALVALRARPGAQPLDDDLPLPAQGVDDALAGDQTRARLRAAIARLPVKQRLVVSLRVFDELSFREVAQVVECSENAAKVQFHHALKKLRALLGGTP
jgi:RNA polymerase sigma-70 factor (ECF subfamily)